MTRRTLSLERLVSADPSEIFDILADPSQHAAIFARTVASHRTAGPLSVREHFRNEDAAGTSLPDQESCFGV